MKDPRRLLDGDGTDEQRALLRAGTREEPPPDGSARVLAALGITAPVGASDAGGLESARSESAAGSGLVSGGGAGTASAIKIALALGTVALLGAGALLWSRTDEPARTEPRTSTNASPSTSANAKPADLQAAGDTQPAGSVALEIEALERARAQLGRKDGQGALAALRAYSREHPAGVLAQEADVLRVEALLLVGERKAASDLAERLLQQRADTPHRARLQGLLQQADAQPEP